MGIMAIGGIIVLSALIVQTLSAPSGCIESCNFFQTSIQHTSGNYQDHANLVQARTNLNDYDYAKPGNWTEHNQYSTDGGHGKIHEERGQYVEGSNRVRYFKKNFTSSYGNVNGINAAELDESSNQHRYDSIHLPSSQHIDSQSAYGLGETVTKETGYNRAHSQQTQSLRESATRFDSKSERLEDFGEYSGYSQVNQHVPSVNTQTIDTQRHVETANNWSKADSYRTDGGHGQVFEEEGQYVTGPKKVRYYKKNYTSSYSSGVPQNSIGGSATLDELHSELQRNLQKDLDSIRRNFHQVSSSGHTAATTHVGSTQMGLTQEAAGFHDLQTAESDGYRQHLGYRGTPSTGSVHHYTEQQRETLTDTRQLPHAYPTAATNTYGTESHQTYQSHESHMSQVQPGQSSHLSSSYVQVPRSGYQTGYQNAHSIGHHVDETRAESLGAHQSSVLQNQLLAENSQRVYNPHSTNVVYPSRHGETRHYEEHWRSSSHTGGSIAPERTIADHSGYGVGHTERAHYDRDAYNEHRGRYHTGYESRARTSGNSHDSAYRTSSGQLATGSLDLGHAVHGADCTEETHQQYQHETRYHRKYKRDDHHGNEQEHQDEDFTQQNQEFGQETQQLEDLTQQTQDDFTQQTSGKLELGQQTIDSHHLDDLTQQSEQFTQQMEGQLELGQQTVNNPQLGDLTQQTEDHFELGQQTIGNPHLEDLTQQTEGQLEFGQQTVSNPHTEDLTQQSEQFTQETQEPDDLTQQTSGKLEFGQQTIDNHHLDDLTQQSEQLTQQTEGQLEFGQQTIDNPHLEDLTQQSEQLTQQTEGQLEFGQQTIDNPHLEDLTQQSEQLTQQTEGQLEFGQQTIDNPHLEDLTQQTQESDDFMQQTSGKLEFGQQADNTQQLEQFAQRTARSDSLTQQIQLDKHEFGQHTVGNQHLEDLTRQNEQFTQQTMGHLEFGQLQQPHRSNKPKVNNHHLEDFTQQNEDITQQTGGFDDFSQQTGHLEYGQQREQQQNPSWPRYNTQRLEHYPQQNEWNVDNLSQQSRQYPAYNNRNNKQSEWQLEQMSQKTNSDQDFTQQTDQDQLAIDLKPAPKPRPRPRYQKHDFTPSHIGGTDTNVDDVFKPVEVNPEADIDNSHGRIIESGSRVTYPGPNDRTKVLDSTQGSVFDNQRENMDRLHWVHKSNDATVGLQWHYTYHPSDLTNVESSHDNYYPRHNVDSMSQQTEDIQQSKPFDFNQQETQDTLDDKHQNSYISQSSQHDQQSESFQQTESHFDNQFNQDSNQTPSRVIPLQHNENLQLNSQLTSEQEKQSTPTTEQTEDKIESRILQAYGGGPYGVPHSDDFYNRVRPNPNATLPPMGGDDPWDIREKPRESLVPRTWSTVRNTPEIVTTTEETETTTQIIETTTKPSFWNRVGNKITSTYDKAKEKAKEIFG